MRLGVPTITSSDTHQTYAVDVDGLPNTPERLWFTVPNDFAHMVTDRVDPAVLALLIPAMRLGADVIVDGPVTSELVHTLQGDYQSVLTGVMPELARVRIEPREQVAGERQAAGVASGFSAGIDSYIALRDHYYADDVPSSLRLTHLTYHNVGSHHGDRDIAQRVFEARYARLATVVARIGLPFIKVDSNLDHFYRVNEFQQTHTPRNLAVALLLQGGIGRYLYASTYPLADLKVAPTYDLGFADAVGVPMLSTPAVAMTSQGSQYTRTAKILGVAEMPESYSTLDVCIYSTDGDNCSVCRKCVRTLLTFEMAGRLDRYDEIFDLERYRTRRGRMIAKTAFWPDVLQRDVRELGRKLGFPFTSESGRWVVAATGRRAQRLRRRRPA